MTCTRVHVSGACATICSGPETVVVRTGPQETKWCFKCRARHNHTWKLIGYTGPSYYDPYWVCDCSNCGEDHRRFPS